MSKQYSIRFNVSEEVFSEVKKVAKDLGQPVGSFSRHLFTVAFAEFKRTYSVEAPTFSPEGKK